VLERRPLTQARSPWIEAGTITILGVVEAVWNRRVGDGSLQVIVGQEQDGWHLSISFADHKGRPSRYPRWDEIADARYMLVPKNVTMVMILPPPEDYVALHDTTFHLHEEA
jgi:hypothetical protein